MATPIKLKRSAVEGKRPGLSDLQLGELALNTNDGNIFIERDAGGVGIATTIANVTPWTENYGGESIYYNNTVGIGTTNPQGSLQIGTGVTVYGSTGIVSATKFYGDGSTLSNVGGNLNITGDSGGGAGVNLVTQTLTIVGTANEVTTSADSQQVQIGFPDTVNVSDLIVGVGASFVGIATFSDTLKVGTAITAHAGIITATKFKPVGGTSTKFLKGDGSLDSNTYLTNYTESSTLDDVLGRGNSSSKGINVGISTLGNVSGGFVKLYNNSNLVFQTVGTGVSIANAGLNTATIFGPPEIIIDPHPVGVATTSGIVRIKGDLYVDGKNFIIDSETITLGDFVIGIASTATTDALADGAGLLIGPDNTFKYEYNSGTNPSLKSSENLNVATGKVYQIAETEVLSADTLSVGTGATVHSPGSNIITLGTNDEERLRIDSGGRLLIGQNVGYDLYANGLLQVSATDGTAAISVTRWSDNGSSPYINLGKSRGAIGAYTVVQDGDRLGQINFTGADGTDLASPAAGIAGYVDGTPGSNDMPGRLVFFTASDGGVAETERMRISASGQIGFNDTSPTEATVSIIQHDSSVTTTGLNIHTNSGGGGSGTQYALKITGTSQNDCPVYGIHIDKTQQYTQMVTGVYSKVTGTYSNPISGHFIVNGASMNSGTYVAGIKGEVESDSGSNSNRTSRAVWGYNGTQQGSDTYAIQADTVTGGNGDLRGFQYLHGGSTKFYVNSSGNVWSASNSYSSDRDIKTDIQTLTGTSLNLIKQLVPKTFKWKESKENEKDGTIYKPDGATLTGFIAQEVQSIIPGIVIGTDGSKEMGINYQGLTAHLVNTIKELSSEIDTLKTKVAALESA